MSNKDFQRIEKIRQLNADNPNWVNRDLYRLLYKRDLYIIAYETLKSKSGNMTADANGNTIDGMSSRTIARLINSMKDESFKFSPARRVEIPKANGKKRPLGIAPPNDKIVQQIIKIILEAIYEPNFSNQSHGFRENRGCHTALKSFRDNWSGVSWIIEGDITGFFDNISHEILISLLRKKIDDERFINLIRKALNAGYMEFGNFVNTIVGTPQGSVVSPILANIYLNEFDKFVEGRINEHETGKRRTYTPEYRSLSSRIQYQRKKAAKASSPEREEIIEKIKLLEAEFAKVPKVINDGSYVRIKYIRYADDWIIGVNGPKEVAVKLRNECAEFLSDKLSLELNMDKTHIRHARSEYAEFLGTRLKIENMSAQPKKVKTTSKLGFKFSKSVTGWLPSMHAPVDKIVKRLAEKGFCDGHGFPISKPSWSVLDDIQIVEQYSSVWNGIANYYSFVDNRSALGRIQYILLYGACKTLAHKHRSSISKVFKKYGKSLRVKIKDDKGKVIRQINFPYRKSLKREPTNFMIWDYTQNTGGKLDLWVTLRSRSKLDSPCCICGNTKVIEMHHVRHIRKMGKVNHGFTLIMAKINRKQIPVCPECHVKIHTGKYDGMKLSDFKLPHIATA